MKFRNNIKSILLTSLIALTFVSCGTSNTNPSEDLSTNIPAQNNVQTQEPVVTESNILSTQYLNVMLDVEVSTLDPQLAFDGSGFEIIANFTDGLMQMGENSEPIPAIAESFDVSDDGLTYTFYLREDAYWSNNAPVTADDFVFGWQRAVDPNTASEYSYMLSDIAQIVNADKIISGDADLDELGVTAIDDLTLQVDLNVPVSYFDSLMYFPTFYPVNREFFEEVGIDDFAKSPKTTLSNGAFVLEDYEPAALSLSFGKNYNYWDSDNVNLAGINYQVVKDSQQAFMSYQSGDLDIVTLSGDQMEQVKDDPELNLMSSGYLWFLTLNINDNDYLDNLNLRLALTNAINRDAITSSVLKDGSIPAFTPVPPKYTYSTEGEDFSYNQARYADVCSYDPTLAQEYFELAKDELGQSNFTFELLLEDSTEAQYVCAVLKEQLETTLEGTTFDLAVSPKKQRVEDIQTGNFEISLTRWGPDYADPMTFLGLWVSNNENNYGLWSNDEYDQIISDCTIGDYINDEEARWLALKDAEAIVMEDAVIIPLYTKSNANMIKPNVVGVEFNTIALSRVYKNATISNF